MPWENIVDETRTLHCWAYAGSVAEFLLEEISVARIDVWEGEESDVEPESRTVEETP